jgi:hypothetical protein
MQCANPDCSTELLYLRSGSLQLLEQHIPADLGSASDDTGFSARIPPRKFFWLCGECTKNFVIRQWTAGGLLLRKRCHEEVRQKDVQIETKSRLNVA